MPMIITSAGGAWAMELLTAPGLILRLFKNDITPGSGSIIGDFEECNSLGYAAVTLIPGTWNIFEEGGVGKANYPQQDFTMAIGTIAYGYYVTSGTTVVFAERFFGGPFTITALKPFIRIHIEWWLS